MERRATRTILAALLLGVGALSTAVALRQPAAGERPRDGEEKAMSGRALGPEEDRVIRGKGTERPFTGKYWNHHGQGTYACRQCGAPLFPSSAKFDSGTGWPSFDRALPGAVKEVPDADGMRIEIVCARCGGHLGHVFRGEGFTALQTRHCVNSVSLDFVAGEGEPDGAVAVAGATASAGTCAPGDGPAQGAAVPAQAEAFFAGGCFWGVEYYLDAFPGVIRAESGYMGGHAQNPTYEQVCAHGTGHVETVRVVYDPAKVTYEALAKRFFEIHDPTQVDRQGPDVGEQYRSVVFYADDAQRQAAQSLIDRLVRRGYAVATRLQPATTFWPAEAYHQDHYARKHGTPYCHARTDRFGDGL